MKVGIIKILIDTVNTHRTYLLILIAIATLEKLVHFPVRA